MRQFAGRLPGEGEAEHLIRSDVRLAISHITRSAISSVLPEPAPATTSSGSSAGAVMTVCCSALNSYRKPSRPAQFLRREARADMRRRANSLAHSRSPAVPCRRPGTTCARRSTAHESFTTARNVDAAMALAASPHQRFGPAGIIGLEPVVAARARPRRRASCPTPRSRPRRRPCPRETRRPRPRPGTPRAADARRCPRARRAAAGLEVDHDESALLVPLEPVDPALAAATAVAGIGRLRQLGPANSRSIAELLARVGR